MVTGAGPGFPDQADDGRLGAQEVMGDLRPDGLHAAGVGGRGRGKGKGKGKQREADAVPLTAEDTAILVAKLEKEMRQAARDLEFEQAAELRDRIRILRARLIAMPE